MFLLTGVSYICLFRYFDVKECLFRTIGIQCYICTRLIGSLQLKSYSEIAPPGWLSGERVGLMTWWLWVRSPIEATFLSGVFSPLTSAEACEKSSRWLWKESCVSTRVRKPGNSQVTCINIMVLKGTQWRIQWRIPVYDTTGSNIDWYQSLK